MQLELEIRTDGGDITHRNKPCPDAVNGVLSATSIPGLDASLCRCEQCAARSESGIWWFDSQMRRRVRKREVAYSFAVLAGDGLRDAEES
jgi:hypothetical protein